MPVTDSGGGLAVELESPPLALYVHIPWCVRKCPYCDFNSHAGPAGGLPEEEYVDRLLLDLEQEVARLDPVRPLVSIFIGGGTPSLFSGASITHLLRGVRGCIDLTAEVEISLEANPGTADAGHFAAYRKAGVNRLSIGVQSMSARHLGLLGRIHGPREVDAAVTAARQAGFDNLNLDLMYGLPQQSLEQARRDLEQVLALEPEHVSYYQLTLEPNTAFHAVPPALPGEDLAADMHLLGLEHLAAAGYVQYEVSAYAQAGRRCRHNLNYWEFGDYLGIGAGAHGKLTDASTHRVVRSAKLRHPSAYLDPGKGACLESGRRSLDETDLALEFAMNALRLRDGFDRELFEGRTGLPFMRIATNVDGARAEGLLCGDGDRVRPTERGWSFLNDLLQRFASSA
ncbi:MAG: radical SAM family heme chaperone HemW [Pseudomonadota bacterium]|nr:radical SAM family heme chaperone HemW [Pseudomonadota bacterium]